MKYILIMERSCSVALSGQTSGTNKREMSIIRCLKLRGHEKWQEVDDLIVSTGKRIFDIFKISGEIEKGKETSEAF